MISGNMVGSYSQMGKTFILVDENGNEITGVCVDNPVVFTAGDNDVRDGMVYASDNGVSTGTKDIPAYHTTEGAKVITSGSPFNIILQGNRYNYSKLQVIICPFASSLAKSVAAEKVVIDSNLYNVNSSEVVSTVTINSNNKQINLGITNTSSNPYILRYFTYQEEY